jgi:hypothetical protein
MNTFLGAEQVLVDTWIEMRLAAVAQDLEDIAPGLSQRIYPDLAPADAPYPVIVYQCQSPPRDVRGVGAVRVMVDTIYVVKAVAQQVSYVPMAPLARVIDGAMTASVPTPVVDGFVLASVRNQQFSLTEVANGKQVRNLGGEYRIHAQAQQ